MTAFLPFIIPVLYSLLISATISAVMAKPLRRLLGDVCGTDERANFWMLYVIVLIFAVPLTAVSGISIFNPNELAMLNVVQRTFFVIFASLIAALIFIGYTIQSHISQQDYRTEMRENLQSGGKS
ncbi:hypothetical protein [Terasakiella pusilla]|uniref:hypothetical protein n=1 Tax=Terasakiella pusilla TaxID=64973 RepID=UPI003AA84233